MVSPDQQELRQGLGILSRKARIPVHFVGSNINTVVIGEEHWRFSKAEAELIGWLGSSKILLEGLCGFIYCPEKSTLETQPGRRYFPTEEKAIWQKSMVEYSEPESNIARLLAPENEGEFLRLTNTRTKALRDRYISR